MSVFFFRLHNLEREEQNRRLKNRSRMNREFDPPSPSPTGSDSRPIRGRYTNAINDGVGRLFEKPPLYPSDSLDEIALQIPRIRVEYYVNERSFKERLQLFFIKNRNSSHHIRLFYLFMKLLACILYVISVIAERSPTYAARFGCSFESNSNNRRMGNFTIPQYQDDSLIDWNAIFWVNRPYAIWVIQIIIAYISIAQAFVMVYLNYRGNLRQQVLQQDFVLEMVTSVPFAITVAHPALRNVFVPVFLNCWLAKNALQNIFNDLHRSMLRSQSALSHQLMVLTATLMCLVFTSVCGIQHLQRAGHRHLNLFQAIYYVVVTFSTVGYGDFVPDIWPSQLYMVLMICIALVVLPTQFEQLAFTWMERQRMGVSYSSHRALSEKHVVVCSTNLHSEMIMDFLNEFYADPLLEDHYVVLLSPMELDNTMRMILQIPIWSQRVVYIQGSCLKERDLVRASIESAEACFVLAARNYADKAAADEHTILRAWALKDYASLVPLYVQITRPENKMHVRNGENVVCEDELKYALLAYNCSVVGISSLVTLLLHTSRGEEGQNAREQWARLYGQYSGNEVYHIRLGDSGFFGEYVGKSFTFASFHSHRKFGVCLVGVRPYNQASLLLNPGSRHIMNKNDICYYLSITKEENSSFMIRRNTQTPLPALEPTPEVTVQVDTEPPNESTPLQPDAPGNNLNVPQSGALSLLSPDTASRHGSRRPSILPVPDYGSNGSDGDDDEGNSEDDLSEGLPWDLPYENMGIVKGFPTASPYIGVNPTLCYLLREKKPLCCLQLNHPCEHCNYRTAYEYNWPNKSIILIADYASKGIYNFVIPLRAHFQAKNLLQPIILLLERRPDPAFLSSLSYFPLVYWMLGSIDSIDDLLRAGILHAETVVVVNKELSNSAEENTLSDCNTILSVQTMYKLFPNVDCITELSQSSNMRFMHFCPYDRYALSLSKMEKMEKERGSTISYMFRLPFAAGKVFSASMLDTLLYQAYVKDYIISFVRLLLGVDQTTGSGFLTSMTITEDDMWIRTYGRLYQKLCSTTSQIPIGIYRTQDPPEQEGDYDNDYEDEDEAIVERLRQGLHIERAEIANMVRARAEALNLPPPDYEAYEEDEPSKVSYVIINPNCDLKLREGDMIYLIAPTPFSARKTFERHNTMRKSAITYCSQKVIQPTPTKEVGSATTRPPSRASMRANNSSLQEKPQQVSRRGRSNSLRVSDDISLKRTGSLIHGIMDMEDAKIPLQDSIEIEVTPPDDEVSSGLM